MAMGVARWRRPNECQSIVMGKTLRHFAETEDHAQEALRHLADIARSAAAEKEHEARMTTLTAGTLTTVRRVLEADARRARRTAWIAVLVGATLSGAAVTVAGVALYQGRERSDHLLRLLNEQRGTSGVLEARFEAQTAVAEVLREERDRDQVLLERFYEDLRDLRDRLILHVSELASVQSAGRAYMRGTLGFPPGNPAVAPVSYRSAPAQPAPPAGRGRTPRNTPPDTTHSASTVGVETIEVFLNPSGTCTPAGR